MCATIKKEKQRRRRRGDYKTQKVVRIEAYEDYYQLRENYPEKEAHEKF